MSSALSQALKSMRRSPYQVLAATVLVFITFFIGYTLTLFMVGSNLVLRYFETRPQVTGFFRQDTPVATLEAHATQLRAQGYIRSVNVVTQEQALEIYRQQIGDDPVMLELVTADILPPSLEVSTTTLDGLAQAATDLQAREGIDEVVYQKDVVDSLRYWTQLLRQIGLVMLAIFTVTAVLVIVIITGIRVATRKTEIRILRLMGATKWYIQQPFLLEGILYGLIGAVLSWVAVYILLLYATPTIDQFFGEVQLVPVPALVMGGLLLSGCSVGIIIGVVSSFWSSRRLLRI